MMVSWTTAIPVRIQKNSKLKTYITSRVEVLANGLEVEE